MAKKRECPIRCAMDKPVCVNGYYKRVKATEKEYKKLLEKYL